MRGRDGFDVAAGVGASVMAELPKGGVNGLACEGSVRTGEGQERG